MNQQLTPAVYHAHSDNPFANPNLNPLVSHSSDYAPYPTLDPNDVAPPPDPLLAQRSDPSPSAVATTMPHDNNPYVSTVPRPTSSTKNAMDAVKGLLGKWGKQTNKAQGLAGNTWQHLKTSPSMTDAAVTRISQLAEGGHEKVVVPLNQLKAVSPSTSKVNPLEKYIQIITIDNHEFWFMGFVNYDSAVENLREILGVHSYN